MLYTYFDFIKQRNTPCYYSMSVVVRGTEYVPRLFFMREVRFPYLDWLYARGVMRGTFSVPRLTIRKVLCKVRFPYLDWLYARGVMRGTFSVPRLALPCSKTDCDCTAIFLPSNLTFVIKSAEIMCCTHILILSSKGNTPCYYSMSVVVRGTYSVPRLFFMREVLCEVRFPYLDWRCPARRRNAIAQQSFFRPI